MIHPSWKRICGVHAQENGQIAAVWLAKDHDSDVIHLYDCHTHDRDVIAVQAESLKRRGTWIPIAWPKEAGELVKLLKDHGCKMVPEFDPPSNREDIAETVSLEIYERMRTGRFKVGKHLERWHDEFKRFYRHESKVPKDSFPLMAATRHAMGQLQYARSQSENDKMKQKLEYPKRAIA